MGHTRVRARTQTHTHVSTHTDMYTHAHTHVHTCITDDMSRLVDIAASLTSADEATLQEVLEKLVVPER